MSEKAACPKCDAYVSQVWYDECHEQCGWNCDIDYEVEAYGTLGSVRLESTVQPPTELAGQLAALVDANEAHVTVIVNGSPQRSPSAWLDPVQETPRLNERRYRANLKALRAKKMAVALERIGTRLGD